MAFKPKGSCVYRYSIRHKRKRYQGSLETGNKQVAQKREVFVRNKIKGDKFEDWVGENAHTFDEMMIQFLDEHGPTVTLSTRNCYRFSLNNLNKFFSGMLVRDIGKKEVNAYKILRRKEGVSGVTINSELSMLSTAMKKAIVEWEWSIENPVSKVSREKPNKGRDRWLTWKDSERLVSCCDPQLRNMVILDLNTGLRLNELLSLEWEDVDLFKRTIVVRDSKNGEPRVLPMTERVFELLKEMSKDRNMVTKLIFPNSKGKRICHQTVWQKFRVVVQKAGIEDFKFHDLRHCFATWLAQEGRDLYSIQRLLGHKDLKNTTRYAHHSVESLRACIEVLNNG